MSTTWSEVKEIIVDLYPAIIQSKFINPDSGELGSYARLANNMIANYPHRFKFTKDTHSLTLTGATSYNLKTLIPGLSKVYQIMGINDNTDEVELPEYEGSISSASNFYLRNGVLYFTGNNPTSGTATIVYKSKYLVYDKDDDSRKLNFEDDDDYSAIPDEQIMTLISIISLFIDWKEADKKFSLADIQVKANQIIAENLVIPDGESLRQLRNFV